VELSAAGISSSNAWPSVDACSTGTLALLRCQPPGSETSRCRHRSAPTAAGTPAPAVLPWRQWLVARHRCGGRFRRAGDRCGRAVRRHRKGLTSASLSVFLSHLGIFIDGGVGGCIGNGLLAMALAVGVGRRDGHRASLSSPGHQCRCRHAELLPSGCSGQRWL
jgi:hypothetical protein